jgi:transcriptional regulator with XRE-family HTH domain
MTTVSSSGAGSVNWCLNVIAIERARVLRGWTRAILAHNAHVDEKTLRDMLSGRRRPTFGTVRAVSNALGMTLSDVILFEDHILAV